MKMMMVVMMTTTMMMMVVMVAVIGRTISQMKSEVASCHLCHPSFLQTLPSMKVALWIKLCCDIIDNSTRLAQVGYRVPWNNYRQLLQIVVGCDGVS